MREGQHNESDLIGFSTSGTWTNIGEGFNNLTFTLYHPTFETYELQYPEIAKKIDHITTKPFTLSSYYQYVDKRDPYALPNITHRNQYETKTAIYNIVRENNLSYSYEFDTVYFDCETYNS